MPARSPPCTRHPDVLAGWSCQDCHAALCPDCTAREGAGAAHFDVCVGCGGRAEVLRVHRSHWPLPERLRAAPRYLLHENNLAAVVGLAAFMAFSGFVARTISVLAVGLPLLLVVVLLLVMKLGAFFAAFFAIVRCTARGEAEVELPDFHDFASSFFEPAARGLVASAVLSLPAVAWLLTARGWTPGAPFTPHLASPVVWLLLLVGALHLPVALVLAATGRSLVAVLNPLAALSAARQLGRDLALIVGVFAAALVPLVLVHWAADLVARIPVLGLAAWLAETLSLLLPLTLAHVLGLLLHVRGDVLGYGLESDYWVPALPSALPRGARTAATAPATAADPVAALRAAVLARDVPAALTHYAQVRALPGVRLEADSHLFVGQAAASREEYPLALEALERAADVAPDAPSAPRALVLLARVLGERLGETSRALDVYRYVVHRYPGTDASRFAAARLSPTAPT